MKNRRARVIGAMVATVAIFFGVYRAFFVWPVGEMGVQIEAPEVLVRNVPTTIMVRTAQSFGQSRRCGATVRVLSDFAELSGIRPVDDAGRMAWEVEVIPKGTGVGSELSLAFSARGGGVEIVREPVRFWPRGDLAIASVEGGGNLAVGKPDRVIVTLNQDAQETKSLNLRFRIQAPDGLEADSIEEVVGETALRVGFSLLPNRPLWEAEAVMVVFHGDIEVARAPFPVTVDAPPYFNADGQTFSEMIGAPDVDIYGSHITVWDRPGRNDRMLVTGHAASEVCRVASAALMGYASYVDAEAPNFFIGAGLGSFDLRGSEDRMQKETADFFERFSDIGGHLTQLANEGAEKMIQFADQLARLADAPGLSDERKAQMRADALQERIKGLSDAWLAYSAPPAGLSHDEMPAVATQVGELAEAVEPRQTLFGRIRRDSISLDADQVSSFQNLLGHPDHAVAGIVWHAAADYHDLVGMVAAMPPAARSDFERRLTVLIELIEANERITRDLDGLETRTGLLKFVPGTQSTLDTAAEAALREAIRDWTHTARDGDLISLTALASGHRGALLLPYLAENGDEVSFTLPRALFESRDGAFIRDLFLKSSVFEFAQLAREAAERTREKEDEMLDSLRRTAGRADRDNLGAWLAQTERVRIQKINERGEVIGVEEVELTRAEGIVAQWRTAASMQRSARLYARLAENAERLNDDQAFLAMIEGCLLDSMLRGWEMSFSDDRMAVHYKTWMEQVRPRVWTSLWQQAESTGMDPRQLITESTVWAVRPAADGTVRITPRFIADIGRSWVAKHGRQGVYGAAWHARQPRMPKASDWLAGGLDASALNRARESDTPAAALREVGASIASATLERLRNDLQRMGWQLSGQDTLAITRILLDSDRAGTLLAQAGATVTAMWSTIESAAGPLELAFASAPEIAAATLTSAILDIWPSVPLAGLTDTEADAFAALRRLPLDDDLNTRWEALGDDLEAGKWPLADHYALFAFVWRHEADDAQQTGNALRHHVLTSRAEKLLAAGRAIDQEHVDAVYETQAFSRRSALRLALESKTRPWAIEDCLQTVVLLSEAQRVMSDWDDAWAVAERVRRGLASWGDDLATAELDVAEAVAALQDNVLALADLVIDEERAPDPGVGAREREAITKGFADLGSRIERRVASANAAERLSWQRRQSRLKALESLATRALVSRPAQHTDASWKRQRLLDVLKQAESALRDSLSLRLIGEDWIPAAAEGIKAVRDEIEAKTSHRLPAIDALDQRRFRARLSSVSGRLAEQAANAIVAWHREEPSRRSIEALVQLYWHSGNYAKALEELTGRTREHIRGRDTTLIEDIPDQALLTLYDRHRAVLIKACVYSGGDFFGASLFGKHPSDWHIQPRSVDTVAWQWDTVCPVSLPAVLGSDIAQLYQDEIADQDVAGRRIGQLEVVSAHKSYTALRAFKVRGPGGESFLKVMPDDPDGKNRAEMAYGAEVADHLARAGIATVRPLPVASSGNRLVFVGDGIVAIRESVAPGDALDEVAEANGGSLSEAQAGAYIRAILGAAVKGADLVAEHPDKKPVRTIGDMREKLMERSRLGRRHLEIFSRCPSQQAGRDAGTAFHDALEAYIKTTWQEDRASQRIGAVGLVHDAIFKNAFLSEDKDGKPVVTLIDFPGDYIGPVGNAISIMLTQLMSGDWTYDQFRSQTLSLIEEYGRQSGRTLDESAVAQIVGDMAYPVYKFMSSDGKQITARARAIAGLSPSASDEELATAMNDGAVRERVDALLQDEVLREKYGNHVRVMQACLRLSLEYEKNPERRAALQALIEAIDEVLRTGIRVAGYDQGPSDTMVASTNLWCNVSGREAGS